MPSSRTAAIAAVTTDLVRFASMWEERRQRPGVTDLTFGNPQEAVLPGYVEALRPAVEPRDTEWFAYKRSEPEARAVVAKSLAEWRGLPFQPEHIALTPGAFGAIRVALDTLVEPGDEVIFSLPPWFFYEPMILATGGVPVAVPVRDDDYDLDLDAIAAALTPRTRLVIVNTPNNPTGRIYPPATLQRLAELLTEHSQQRGSPIYLLSDEPYSRLVFSDASFTSPADFYPHTLISYSYAKVQLTPGQRLGWLALSPGMPGADQLAEAVTLSQMVGGWLFPSALMQHALPQLESLTIDLAELERKRDLMVTELRRLGYSLQTPEATFYLWVRSPGDDVAFCDRLASHGVLVLPGTLCRAPGHFRIALTASAEALAATLPAFEALAPS